MWIDNKSVTQLRRNWLNQTFCFLVCMHNPIFAPRRIPWYRRVLEDGIPTTAEHEFRWILNRIHRLKLQPFEIHPHLHSGTIL